MSTSHTAALHRARPCNAIHRGHRTGNTAFSYQLAPSAWRLWTPHNRTTAFSPPLSFTTYCRCWFVRFSLSGIPFHSRTSRRLERTHVQPCSVVGPFKPNRNRERSGLRTFTFAGQRLSARAGSLLLCFSSRVWYRDSCAVHMMWPFYLRQEIAPRRLLVSGDDLPNLIVGLTCLCRFWTNGADNIK